MKHSTAAFLAVAMAAAAGACDSGDTIGTTSETENAVMAVQEAVIREMMSTYMNGPDEVVCIDVDLTGSQLPRSERPDPPKEFLQRFQDTGRMIVPGSECGLEAPVGDMLHHPSQRASVLYEVGKPVFFGASSALTAGGWHRGGLWGHSCTFELERAAGEWRVVHCRDPIEN